jgi:hypothetical protein
MSEKLSKIGYLLLKQSVRTVRIEGKVDIFRESKQQK